MNGCKEKEGDGDVEKMISNKRPILIHFKSNLWLQNVDNKEARLQSSNTQSLSLSLTLACSDTHLLPSEHALPISPSISPPSLSLLPLHTTSVFFFGTQFCIALIHSLWHLKLTCFFFPSLYRQHTHTYSHIFRSLSLSNSYTHTHTLSLFLSLSFIGHWTIYGRFQIG